MVLSRELRMTFTHFCLAWVKEVFSRERINPCGRRLRLLFTKLVTAKAPSRPVIRMLMWKAPTHTQKDCMISGLGTLELFAQITMLLL
eukprot:scaffold47282_cov20-Tisochrysis_lutea.AAC.1